MAGESSAPADRSWIVAIHPHEDSTAPVGAGVVIDARRVLTCAHVAEKSPTLWVAFPNAKDPFGPRVAVAGVRAGEHRYADAAVLDLAGPLPPGVIPARLRRPRGADLVGKRWWAYGFTDEIGNDAAGVVGADLTYGWVRVDGERESRYHVEPGFSGAGLWSPDYEAVVGLLGQAHRNGDGRGFLLHAAASVLEDDDLVTLIESGPVAAAGVDAALSWGWELATDPEGRRHWRPRARGVIGDAEGGFRFRGRRVALTEIVGWLTTKPREPARPVAAAGATELRKPTELLEPTEPLEPTELLDPSETLDATEAPDPPELDPWEPLEPAEPTEPLEPLDPTEALELTEPGESRELRELRDLLRQPEPEPLYPGERPEPSRPEPKVLVVTGSPGVGKSAVLARVVTTADAGIAAELPPDDDAVRAPIGAVACAVHAKSKTALEVATEIARAASARLPERFEVAVPAIRAALTEQGRRSFNIVVDALDEAASPAEARRIVRNLLVPLAETCADVGLRVVAGMRRKDDGGDLVAAFGPAHQTVDLDLPLYFALEDLTAYTMATLQLRGAERPGNPYADDAVAGPVAARIAELAEPNFLVAGLRARTRGLYDVAAVDVAAIGEPQAGDPVAAALREYLAVVPSVGPVTATDALTALAYAEAPGLTLDLWSTAVTALTGQVVAESELAAFVGGSAANFLVGSFRSTASYRLFHQALNNSLIAGRDTVADQRALTRGFVAAGRAAGWSQPYLLRSLAHHAAEGNYVDAVLAEPALLLRADLRRLIPVVGLATTNEGMRRARLLRRTPAAVRATPERRLGLLSLTEALDDLGSDFRALRAPAPFLGVWAHVQRGGEEATLEGHTGGVTGVCAIRAGNRDLLATASDDATVRLWDPGTGEAVATLAAHTREVRGVCAVRVGDREVLASASDDRTVRLWDPATGRALATLKGHTGGVTGLCAIRDGDRDLLASAGDDRTVRLWDPATGEAVAVLHGHTRGVTSVCAVRAGDRDVLASASNDRTVRLWDPDTGEALATLKGHTDWVRGVWAVRDGDRDLLASASDDRTVRLWDPGFGEEVTSSGGHTGGVNGVCSVRAGDRDLLASAGDDRTVRLWDPVTGEASTVAPTQYWALAVATLKPGLLGVGLTDGLLVIRIGDTNETETETSVPRL